MAGTLFTIYKHFGDFVKCILRFCCKFSMKIIFYLISEHRSLRTADAFPVIFRRERSDDRKCVCCSQVCSSPSGSVSSARYLDASLLSIYPTPGDSCILFTDSPPVPPSEQGQTRVSYEQNGFPDWYRINKQRNFTNNQASCSRNTRRR